MKKDLRISEEFLKKAVMLHEAYPVVDAHLDLAGEIWIRQRLGEKSMIRNHYLNHWKRVGISLILSSVYVPDGILKEGGAEAAWQDALSQIKALWQEVDETEEVMAVRNKGELRKALLEKRIGILLYMEGLDCIGEELSRLKELHGLGVRGASLTWSRKNALAAGCAAAGKNVQIPGGLTALGKKAVEEIEALSWFLDISHLNDDGFAELAQLAKRPFIATHSCARAVYNNYRNLTDEQMKLLAAQGGIMGLNGCQYIAGSRQGNHIEMLCRHAEYEMERLGASHVGFGFDLCDSYDLAAYELRKSKGRSNCPEEKQPEKADCLLNHGQIPLLTAALLQRGMKEEDVVSMMGGNFIEYFEKMLPE